MHDAPIFNRQGRSDRPTGHPRPPYTHSPPGPRSYRWALVSSREPVPASAPLPLEWQFTLSLSDLGRNWARSRLRTYACVPSTRTIRASRTSTDSLILRPADTLTHSSSLSWHNKEHRFCQVDVNLRWVHARTRGITSLPPLGLPPTGPTPPGVNPPRG